MRLAIGVRGTVARHWLGALEGGGGAPAHCQYANYWAPLTRKRHIPPHPAQPRHTNHWALGVRGTVAGHRLGALEVGGGSNASLVGGRVGQAEVPRLTFRPPPPPPQ